MLIIIYSFSLPFSSQLNKQTYFSIVPGITFMPDKLGDKNLGKNFYGNNYFLATGLNFDISNKLNLSYRNHSLPITKEWIGSVLKEFGIENPIFTAEISTYCDVIVCDEDGIYDPTKAVLVIDYYGNILSVFGKKIL